MARSIAPAPVLYRLDSPTTRVLLIAAVASGSNVPTRVELDHATTFDITGLISEIQGFETDIETTSVTAWGTDALPQTITGPRTIAASTLVTKASKDGEDIRALVDPGDIVWLDIMTDGDTPTSLSEVWKVEVSNHTASKAAGQEGRIMTKCNIVDGNESAVIPA
jgi:hypothetical protein